MSVYLIPLQSALLLFPFLAAIITLPYIIIQYRKYGSILPIRVLIVYSFIFYLLCAYFLVILPLPPIEEVASYTKPVMQLIPFASLKEFTMNSSLIWNDPSTYLTALNEPSLYLILFNILLTIPFGIYLRYYFQCGWKKTLLFTFLLTLSFECLQLSALFGIYPRPYRLFDVDDLIPIHWAACWICNHTGILLISFHEAVWMKKHMTAVEGIPTAQSTGIFL
ncbi:MAG: VanZ family protein [Clostridium sp.]